MLLMTVWRILSTSPPEHQACFRKAFHYIIFSLLLALTLGFERRCILRHVLSSFTASTLSCVSSSSALFLNQVIAQMRDWALNASLSCEP